MDSAGRRRRSELSGHVTLQTGANSPFFAASRVGGRASRVPRVGQARRVIQNTCATRELRVRCRSQYRRAWRSTGREKTNHISGSGGRPFRLGVARWVGGGRNRVARVERAIAGTRRQPARQLSRRPHRRRRPRYGFGGSLITAQALRVDPRNPDLLERAFAATLSNGDEADANALAERLVARDPNNSLARLATAVHAIEQGQYAAARAQLMSATRGRET